MYLMAPIWCRNRIQEGGESGCIAHNKEGSPEAPFNNGRQFNDGDQRWKSGTLAVRIVLLSALARLVRVVRIDILALAVAVLIALVSLIRDLLLILVRVLIGVLAWV
jgi:hypothetical protein